MKSNQRLVLYSRDQDRFADLVNTVDGIVWEVDAHTFDFTYVNPYAQDLLGYEVEEWYAPGFWVDIMHPEDRTWAVSYCADCLEQKIEKYEFEYRVISKDGREVWLRDLVTLCFENGEPRWLRGIMIDITLSKVIEAQLESSQAQFQSIFKTAPVGILLVDANSHAIVEANPAYCNLVGRTRDMVFEEGWETYTHPDDLGEEMQNARQVSNGEIVTYEYVKRYIKPDGKIVHARTQVVSIGEEKAVDGSQYLIIIEDITERQEFESKIWRQANYDYLTDLPNRNMFQDRASQLIKEYTRSQQKFAVLMIDLDGFKDVNDTLGHDMGDELLIQASRRIQSCIRDSDTLARLGGDEFVVILTHISHISGVEIVAGKINASLAAGFELDEGQVFVSASIGITVYPNDGEAVLDLLKNADQAMYLAKRKGRNRHQFFTQDLRDQALTRMSLVNDLREAVEKQQFELYYQPIINVKTGEVVKAESLIRWNHEQRGLVSPVEFIPLAEESRLIIDIGDWVFREATRQVKKWKQTFRDDFQISVNTSPIQYESRIGDDFNRYLEEQGVDGRNIGIEITENLFMTSNNQVLDTLLNFRDSGIQVSLDDFGTGYSSLSYL
ncbi:MAG: diguanylate cyclase, partial [Pseudomonadota bacterium]